ncbi:MAG: response regulator [Calditrichaeota bacterium]|nr:MAG: response regulator [Calditrichota bacterium]
MLRSKQLFQSISASRATHGQLQGNVAKKILVADDDPYVLRALTQHLNNMGYETVSASDGDNAVQILSETEVDLIISDVVMPGMNGLQFCQYVKSDVKTSHIPFIFISVKDQLPDKLIGFQTGADDYITKPFELSELKVRIESLLTKRKEQGKKDSKPKSKDAPKRTANKANSPQRPQKAKLHKLTIGPDFAKKRSEEAGEGSQIGKRNDSGFAPDKVEAPEDLAALADLENTVKTRFEKVVEDELHLHDAETEEQNQAIANLTDVEVIDYESVFGAVEKTIEGIKSGHGFDIEEIMLMARRVLKSIHLNNDLILQALSNYQYDPFKCQLVNVSIFAMKIGIGLRLNDEDLTKLGAASLIHDVGHLALPESLLPEALQEREDRLTKEEIEELRTHPLKGVEILEKFIPDLRTDYNWLYMAVLQEHERINGSGYPNKINGDDISLYAKIIAVADTFESLAHKRPYKQDEFITYMAMQKIIRLKDKEFDAKVIKAMIGEISLFPLDSYVKLNTGDIGKVIKINHRNPLRPVIKVYYDKELNEVHHDKVIDLKDFPFIFVVKPIYDLEYELRIMSKN